MIRVNGGVIKFLQRIRTGDYEHKEAAAELSFSAPDGEALDEAEVDVVGQQTVAQVAKMLAPKPVVRPPKLRTEAPKDGVKPPADPPSEVVRDESTGVLMDVTEPKAPDVTDRVLTDAVGARQAKFVAAKREDGAKLIRELIWKFAIPAKEGVPARLPGIPQDQRRKFLKELEELA